MPHFTLRLDVLATAFILFAVPDAMSVVVVTDTADQQQAPTAANLTNGDPGWARVGILGPGTGVYLGNGLVLTANHVNVSSPGSITLPNPSGFGTTSYSVSTTPNACRIQNPSGLMIAGSPGTANTDLIMLKFDVAAGSAHASLPMISIATSPAVADQVVLIGTGQVKNGETTSGGTTVFTSGVRGNRWGTNEVAVVDLAAMTTLDNTDVISFETTFDDNGSGTESQAQTSDSGAGVFRFNPGTSSWELAGVVHAVSTGSTSTATFGSSSTFSADLGFYNVHSSGDPRNSISSCVTQLTAVPEPNSFSFFCLLTTGVAGWTRMRSAAILVDSSKKERLPVFKVTV